MTSLFLLPSSPGRSYCSLAVIEFECRGSRFGGRVLCLSCRVRLCLAAMTVYVVTLSLCICRLCEVAMSTMWGAMFAFCMNLMWINVCNASSFPPSSPGKNISKCPYRSRYWVEGLSPRENGKSRRVSQPNSRLKGRHRECQKAPRYWVGVSKRTLDKGER